MLRRIFLATLMFVSVPQVAVAAEGLTIGLGKASVGSEICVDSLLVTQEFGDQRWLAGLATHGEGTCRNMPMRANIDANLLRTTRLGDWMFGFGMGIAEHGDRGFGPRDNVDRVQLHAAILVRRYLWQEQLVLDLFHTSTGGSTHYNPGKNYLVLGYRF